MNEIEEGIVQTVTAMWTSLFETDIQPSDSPANSDIYDLVGCIHIMGPEGGVVTLECSEPLARDVASKMFGLPPADVNIAEAEDALGELANIMGGNFKVLCGAHHALSRPTVVEGRDFRARFIGTRLEGRIAFAAGENRLVASFFRDATSSAAANPVK